MKHENALNIPNLLTALRIALLPWIVWCFLKGFRADALMIYIIAMLSDAADGLIARQTGQITSLGKLLDPVADKLCLATLLVLFAYDGQIPLWVLNLMLLREAVLIIGSVAALNRGIVVSSLPIGKLSTFAFVLSTVARFLLLQTAADILLWISIALSIAALVWYAVVFIQRLQMQRSIV